MKVLGKFKRLIPVLCLAATGLAAGGLCAAEAGAGWMFMQVAASGHFDEDTLTLTGVPKTIAFTVRPERKVEQISNSDFAVLWGAGGNSFAADPPNAALTYEADGRTGELVVELSNIALTTDGVVYHARILQGTTPPPSFESTTLFIDCLGLIEVCNQNN